MFAKQSDVREVSQLQMKRLVQSAERAPSIALMGEFSAGKTTLINFLMGMDILPTRVTATKLPPIWLSYGEEAAYLVGMDGQREKIDIPDLATVSVEGVKFVRVFCKAGILEYLNLIDTPGISDPNIPREVSRAAMSQSSGVIWCTHATQAWRESERSAWDALPQRLRDNSILLATRSDKLAPANRSRVLMRLKRETADRFQDIIMYSATEALEAVTNAESGDLWETSGSASLMAALQDMAERVYKHRATLLERYQAVGEPLEEDDVDDAYGSIKTINQGPLSGFTPTVAAPSKPEAGLDNDQLTELSDDAAESTQPLELTGPENDPDIDQDGAAEREVEEASEPDSSNDASDLADMFGSDGGMAPEETEAAEADQVESETPEEEGVSEPAEANEDDVVGDDKRAPEADVIRIQDAYPDLNIMKEQEAEDDTPEDSDQLDEALSILASDLGSRPEAQEGGLFDDILAKSSDFAPSGPAENEFDVRAEWRALVDRSSPTSVDDLVDVFEDFLGALADRGAFSGLAGDGQTAKSQSESLLDGLPDAPEAADAGDSSTEDKPKGKKKPGWRLHG